MMSSSSFPPQNGLLYRQKQPSYVFEKPPGEIDIEKILLQWSNVRERYEFKL